MERKTSTVPDFVNNKKKKTHTKQKNPAKIRGCTPASPVTLWLKSCKSPPSSERVVSVFFQEQKERTEEARLAVHFLSAVSGRLCSIFQPSELKGGRTISNRTARIPKKALSCRSPHCAGAGSVQTLSLTPRQATTAQRTVGRVQDVLVRGVLIALDIRVRRTRAAVTAGVAHAEIGRHGSARA